MTSAQIRAKLLAQSLRASINQIGVLAEVDGDSGWTRMPAADYANGLKSIEAIAEELEAIADPRPRCTRSRDCQNPATTRYRRRRDDGQLLVYARCDAHPLTARAGIYAKERIAPDPDGGAHGR